MKKNIIKTIIFSFLLFFSIAFINVDGVKADCSCYYYAQYTGEDQVGAGSNGVGGNIAQSIKGSYNYFAEINFTQSGDSSIVRSCNNHYTESDVPTASIVTSFVNNCSGQSLSFSPTSTFKITAAIIANKDCSVSACDKAKLYLEGSSTIVNKKTPISFAAKNKDDFEKKIEEEQKKESEIAGDDDIDPSLVKNWGKHDTGQTVEAGSVSCDLIPQSIMEFLNNLFLIIQILGILLLVVLSGIEFIKAITGADDDGLKGAIKNIFRRIIMVILLLILPAIIIWALNIINDNRYEKENGSYVIGTDGNPLCK